MSAERKDLLTKPNGRGFAPIVTETGGGKGAVKPITRQATALKKGDGGDEDEEEENGGDDMGEGVEKGKVKKGMPPGLAQAQAAKEGKADDAQKEGDEGGEAEQGEQQKKDAKGKPPPFMKSDAAEVTTDDLEKSIEKLNQFVEEGSPVSKKEALLEKAQTGELSKSEREELFQILGGKTEASKPSVAEQVTKGLVENDDLQKALDVSDYLQEQHTALVKSLSSLGECLEKSDKRQHDFNLVLAKAMADIGNLTKTLATRVGQIETTPARAPKSQGVNKPAARNTLQKGFGGDAPSGESDQLSKSQIMDGMELLLRKSGEEGRIQTGESILHAISKYESTNQISKSMLGAVMSELGAAH